MKGVAQKEEKRQRLGRWLEGWICGVGWGELRIEWIRGYY